MSIEAMKLALQYIEANAETKDEHEIATGLRQAIREHAIYEMQRLGQEIEQEPVAYMYESVCGNDFATRCAAPSYAKNIRPLYTHPQQRTWVDLTDDEMLMIYGQQHEGKKYSLGRMVQQAIKEKNT